MAFLSRSFAFESIHNAKDTTIKLAELVRYADQHSDLRRMTDFVRCSDKYYDMSVLIKHDMGKRAYYTSTIIDGTVENRPDGTTVVQGTARIGKVYLSIVLAIGIFAIIMMIGTLSEPIVAGLWAVLLLFMLSHIRQMVTDRQRIIRDMMAKCQEPLLTQDERDALVGDWQPISRYSEGNFYNTQAQ